MSSVDTLSRIESTRERVVDTVERVVVTALRALILLFVTAATVILYVLFVGGLPAQLGQISSADHLLEIMQTAFGGVLGVVLGLELSETLKSYFAHHQVRLEVILVIAIIAVSRHLIQMDFEHTSASMLLGLGVLILCLTLGYVLVKRANLSFFPTKSTSSRRNTLNQALRS
jgi:uncharacterized membrane protein (DUF373 family)